MKEMIRLDKFLSQMGVGSRKDVKEYAKKGRILVNGCMIKKTDIKVCTENDVVSVDGKIVTYVSYEYYMLNKPQGVISATEDKYCTTVIELIKEKKRNDLFPVGRLDKDTVGLLLITNDGELAHDLLSPSKHIKKTYFTKIEGCISDDDILKLRNGFQVDESFKTKPAGVKVIKKGEISEVELTIYEGKYHQVKRMFASLGHPVLYLKRLSMGNLKLDTNLEEGSYRKLTSEEIDYLKTAHTVMGR